MLPLPDLMDFAAKQVRDAELPPDPFTQQRLLVSALALDAANEKLITRLRLVATGQVPCDAPPDLAGLCMCCGRPIAPPVAGHTTGCNPFASAVAAVATHVKRSAVRTRRLSRRSFAVLWGQS